MPLLAQAQALHRAGRLGDASPLYEQALALNPDDGTTLHMAGVLAVQLGQAELGVARLERALNGGFRSAGLLDSYGAIKLGQGDLTVAVASFQEGLRLTPDSGSLWFNLGVAERQAGRVQAAIDAFVRAAALLGEAFAEHALGLALQEVGRLADAASAYGRALRLDPNAAASALNAGVIAHQAGDLPGAVALYRRAIASDPHLPGARVNLAAALQDGGDPHAAAAAFRAILAEDSGCVEAMSNLGATLRSLGDDIGAEAQLRGALALDPFHAAASDNLTKLLLGQGRASDAVALRKACSAAHPHDARSWLELARVLLRTHDGTAEAAALTQALACDPARAEAHCRLGDCAQRRRDWAAAAAHYRLARDLAPDRPQPWVGLALVALKTGDGSAALAACDALLGQNAFDQAAIAYRILALRLCDDAAQADWLSDPDALVSVIPMAMAPDTLQALGLELKAVRNRAFAPDGQSVRGGTQTQDELFAEPLPNIQAFRSLLDGVLAQYLAGRPRDGGHPFFAARPERLIYHSWSVVLRDAGYHVPHIHPGGCISGVFYVDAPALDPASEAGCLEIGAPGLDVALPSMPGQRVIRPVPGRLVLFPSYLWHGTRPFSGPGERITVAFDVRHGRQPDLSDRW